ncbi:hypothetical protein E4T38_04493 [Aureobasidium subglaciale]|nr:hypothetical protein E4T38_04493 [Aureobasidium subglaciale]KAI5223869.1 hypothetical protein E4T40_04269 [Aureobasidium subglaciale]KAI5227459.1 hypothetical protein E4T41_04351 [Aureobasidium subglaciale]KAI5262779.1 hypothetical protein E4T46_04237 [Aureobasidium subglaciale]
MRFSTISALLCAVRVLAAPSTPHEVNGLAVSVDGKCGSSNGQTCLNSYLGDCCSSTGVCGEGAFFCGLGCQKQFGACVPTDKGKLVSQNGMCGHDMTCKGSKFGDCCGKDNWCGSNGDSCGTGCREDNGSCNGGSLWSTNSDLTRRADPNPTCPKSNGTTYTSETGNQYNITCGLDHSGGDLKMVYISSNKIGDCLAECDATDGCKAIAMSGTACYMKSRVGTPVKNSVARGAIWIGKVESSSSSISSIAPETTATSSSESISASASLTVPSASSSASLTASSIVSDAQSSSTISFTSVLPTSTSPTCPKANNTIFIAESGATFLIECYVDYLGGDLKAVSIASNRIADCVNACDATEGCIDISMSGTACYMKKKLGKPLVNKTIRGARKIKDAPKSSSSGSVSSTTSGTDSNTSGDVASTTSSTSSDITTALTLSSDSSSAESFASSTKSATSSETSSDVFISSSTLSSVTSSEASSEASSASSLGSGAISTNSTASSSAILISTSLTTEVSSPDTTSLAQTDNSDSAQTTLSGNNTSHIAPSTSSLKSSAVVGPTAPIVTGPSSGLSFIATSGAPYGNGTSTVSGGPTAPIISSSSASSSAAFSNSTSDIVPSTSTVLVNSTSTIVSGSTTIVGPTAPIAIGPSSIVSLSFVSEAPYGNATSAIGSAGPTAPTETDVSTSSILPANGTSSDTSSSSTVLAPIGTGPSSGISSYATSGAPFSNGTTSVLPFGPTGTGVSTFVTTSKTVIVAPIGTGASSSISSSATSGAPFGTDTTSALPVGPTGTGLSSSTITSSEISSAQNATFSLTTRYNLTSSIASTVLTLSANSTVTAPLTTAPIVTGPATSLSTSSGKYTNTTSSASTTSSTAKFYQFNNYGGISSGHPLATNTSACSTKPTSTATCVRCEGQPGTDKYCGLTINDDSYAVVPKTCNTVEYSLDLTECIIAPDGTSRKALCINGQFPGPLLEASWGDEVVIHVTNSMSLNGTSIHWHGIRQNYTNEMDGVVGLTQCALAPGQSMTYKWMAESYGFSWYHSHLTLQAYEGLFGPMYIAGPKSADYDVDAGHLIINDWSHIPVDDMYNDAQVAGVRTMDTGLINGMNINPAAKDGQPAGVRYTVPTEFVPGKKYLFQLLNSAIQSTYKFYIDGHKFTVIATDFVPIEPYETTVLSINIGQRYEIIVEADQDVGDYFLRFDNQNACASTINSDDIRGIIHYAGSPGLTPNSTAHTYPRKDNGVGGILGTCEDEPLASLVPVLKKTVSSPHETVQHDLLVSNSNAINLYRWYLDGTTFQANWADATLYSIINNDTVPTYSGDLAISTNLGEWVYVIIESPIPLGHPIHLHGHDFYILAAGYGTYGAGTALNLNNPPRRDVAFMPGDGPTGQGGHLVIAFFTDNPGVWLMHCHIGWHVAMGFALQFIEGQELIKDSVANTCLVNDVCTTWRPWAQENGIHTDDSGV